MDPKATLDWPLGSWWQSVSDLGVPRNLKWNHSISEDLLDKFAIFQEKLYFYMSKIPRWMYLILSGGLGSLLLQVFHRKMPTTSKPAISQPKPESVSAIQQQNVAQAGPSSSGTKKEGALKRKGNKK